MKNKRVRNALTVVVSPIPPVLDHSYKFFEAEIRAASLVLKNLYMGQERQFENEKPVFHLTHKKAVMTGRMTRICRLVSKRSRPGMWSSLISWGMRTHIRAI